ncbi:alpha-amylase family protein [Endozoicomonadaceae bacterium StTr2]
MRSLITAIHRACFWLVLLAVVHVLPATANTILHAFNWTYPDISSKAAEIAQLGYKTVLVSPPLKSTGDQWWARYQPQDYRVIENPLGNTHDFRNMVTALGKHNVAVYADVVLNHMANEAAERSDLNYPGKKILDQYASNWNRYNELKLFGDLSKNLFSAADFHPSRCIRNYSSVFEVENWRLCGAMPDTGLPDLTDNSWVIEQQQHYLQALKDMGIRGFRVDAAKHMSLNHIKRVIAGDIGQGMHVFGEIITSGGAGNAEYTNFLKPFLERSDFGAYDFPLFNSIRNAFDYGGSLKTLVDPLAYGQALQPARAITFVTTHDIPNNQGFRYLIMDPADEQLGYAYILGRDGGVPLVYSDHNESGDKRWVDAWKAAPLTAMISFHNAVQGQPMKIIGSGDCFLLFSRGHSDAAGVVGINKCRNAQEYWVNTHEHKFFWNQPYVDVLNPADKFEVKSQWHRLYIPPRTAKMWLRQ